MELEKQASSGELPQGIMKNSTPTDNKEAEAPKLKLKTLPPSLKYAYLGDNNTYLVIINSSLSNCIVLDAFGGSGSTLIACEQSERICYTIELDEKFCDVIVKRYIEQVGTSENITVHRDGKTIKYKEVEGADG